MQTTLRHSVSLSGTGLHSGAPAEIHIRPVGANTGIVFRRTDVAGVQGVIPALWKNVEVSPLNTRLRNGYGVSVSTIEHVMAALAGCGVHNALVEIDGPEVPIMDGSAAPFVRELLAAGLTGLDTPLRAIKILREVTVERGDARATLSPATSLQIDFTIDFPAAAIGRQRKVLNLANGSFVRELCDSRTFCLASDITAMRGEGRALGGTLDNAVVFDGDEVLTPGGLRHGDEPVRHKMLDALGDLFTAGAPILGRYTGHKSGHALTNLLLRKLFATQGAWRMIDCTPSDAARLPGVGVSAKDLSAVA